MYIYTYKYVQAYLQIYVSVCVCYEGALFIVYLKSKGKHCARPPFPGAACVSAKARRLLEGRRRLFGDQPVGHGNKRPWVQYLRMYANLTAPTQLAGNGTPHRRSEPKSKAIAKLPCLALLATGPPQSGHCQWLVRGMWACSWYLPLALSNSWDLSCFGFRKEDSEILTAPLAVAGAQQ